VYFKEAGIPAYVRREYQNVNNFIGTDITVDSPALDMPMAIECKSRKPLKRYNLKDLFKNEQFERIDHFLQLSGRRGFLAIEAHGRPKNKYFVIRWGELRLLFDRKQKSFTLYDPAELPRPVKKDEIAAKELVKTDGKWNIGDCFGAYKLGDNDLRILSVR
jgi:hypothetical protein